MAKEWFSTWFDSPYYHILYGHRDENEAAAFIKALQHKIHLKEGSLVLDAACGKGRHAKTLWEAGFKVEAYDLSESNIVEAKSYETQDLKFFQHDMRNPLPQTNYYQAIFNFFTSFGYFETSEENQLAFYRFFQGLQKGGLLVLDFFNPTFVLANLVAEEVVERSGIQFQIKRFAQKGYLYKIIEFSDGGKEYQFEEKVEIIQKNDFISYASQAGFKTIDLVGDYELNSFDEKSSPRMIFFWAKQ
ncbi:MAG: hypothetical protein RJA76_401 [Bacteroidota bacterium]